MVSCGETRIPRLLMCGEDSGMALIARFGNPSVGTGASCRPSTDCPEGSRVFSGGDLR